MIAQIIADDRQASFPAIQEDCALSREGWQVRFPPVVVVELSSNENKAF